MKTKNMRNTITRTYEFEIDQAIADLVKRGYILEKKGKIRKPADQSVVWQASMIKEVPI